MSSVTACRVMVYSRGFVTSLELRSFWNRIFARSEAGVTPSHFVQSLRGLLLCYQQTAMADVSSSVTIKITYWCAPPSLLRSWSVPSLSSPSSSPSIPETPGLTGDDKAPPHAPPWWHPYPWCFPVTAHHERGANDLDFSLSLSQPFLVASCAWRSPLLLRSFNSKRFMEPYEITSARKSFKSTPVNNKGIIDEDIQANLCIVSEEGGGKVGGAWAFDSGNVSCISTKCR